MKPRSTGSTLPATSLVVFLILEALAVSGIMLFAADHLATGMVALDIAVATANVALWSLGILAFRGTEKEVGVSNATFGFKGYMAVFYTIASVATMFAVSTVPTAVWLQCAWFALLALALVAASFVSPNIRRNEYALERRKSNLKAIGEALDGLDIAYVGSTQQTRKKIEDIRTLMRFVTPSDSPQAAAIEAEIEVVLRQAAGHSHDEEAVLKDLDKCEQLISLRKKHL